MADLNLDGNAPANETTENKGTERTHSVRMKSIPAQDRTNEYQVIFGNVDRTKILMAEMLNKNIVALTGFVKLLIPEEKLKAYEEKMEKEKRGKNGGSKQ